MKKTLYLPALIFALILTGCSSTYKVSDFSSKDKFYEDFNKSVNDNSVKITLNNDSSFISNNSVKISNDTLSLITQVQEEKRIDKNEIKYIKYYGSDMSSLSANILLKDGTSVRVKNISIFSDSSIQFIAYRNIYKQIPLNNIKEVSYKKRWLGAVIDFFIGIPAGVIAGYLVFNATRGHTQNSDDQASTNAVHVVIATPIVFGIFGWIKGYTYTYQFNP
jgi:hypothetical protein